MAASCGNGSTNEPAINPPAVSSQNPELILGCERIEEYLPLLRNKRIGIIGNQTSVIPREEGYTHLVDSLLSLNIAIEKVFAPEHGFRGTAEAGEVVQDGKDIKTGLPVISLYGSNKKPSSEQLEGLDLLIFDIQDVGARFYTYISTLHYVMEAAAEKGLPILILDRPNPNGHYVDGPVLESPHKSFVGMHPIPVVHGMTIGEYARMINGEKWLNGGIQAELRVVPMKNYSRNQPYDLPVRPSPNLPNSQAINLYPSLCFFEGTQINAGRGTSKQFQIFGSPYLPSERYTFQYIPEPNEGASSPKHMGVVCYGKDLTKVEHLSQLNLEWLIHAYRDSQKQEDFFTPFFTLLAGTERLQQQIQDGMSAEAIKQTWEEDLERFRLRRKPYLLY